MVIEIKNFTRQYGTFTAVDDISLEIEAGRIFGLLGPNGAGKSTTVKAITGAIKPTSGAIFIKGKSMKEYPAELKAKIGYIPENPVVFKNLTGKEYLYLVGKLYHMPSNKLGPRIDEMLEKFGLAEKAGHQLLSYSKGMTQKLLIISALLHNPEILILDEPLGGLDAGSAAVFKETIRSFAARGKTILFSSHILEVVEKLCDRIAILVEGRILSTGTAQDIVRETGTGSLEEAFIKLTGQTDIEKEAEDIISALE